MVKGRPEPSWELIRRVGDRALQLPEAYEEEAWTGVRWRIRQKTFAHVTALDPARAREWYGAEDREYTVVTFRSSGPELDALLNQGPPFLKPTWAPTVVALELTDDTDWDEVGELLAESYRFMAPQKLARLLDDP